MQHGFTITQFLTHSIAFLERITKYRKCVKIRWAKHSWFQPYEVFCENAFAVHWPPVFIVYLYLKIHGKTVAILSKTTKTVNV